jgi:hypothetical protein
MIMRSKQKTSNCEKLHWVLPSSALHNCAQCLNNILKIVERIITDNSKLAIGDNKKHTHRVII